MCRFVDSWCVCTCVCGNDAYLLAQHKSGLNTLFPALRRRMEDVSEGTCVRWICF